MHANAPKIISLYKKGRNGKIYPKKVYSSDWKGEYEPTVQSSSEQEQGDIKSLQKWSLAKAQFPDNPAVQRIAAKRLFEVLDVTSEEMKEIQDAEEQKQKQMETQGMMQQGVQPEMAGIQESMNQLNQVTS